MKFSVVEDLAPGSTPATSGSSRIARGTDQQEAFWAELTDGSGHVLLEARAGTGKSSSCREGMWRLLARDPGLSIRYCCFNRAVADEFGLSCPTGVDVGTMHRFGLQALGAASWPKIEGTKSYLMIDAEPDGKKLPRYFRKSVSMLVSLAKNQGYRPDRPTLVEDLAELAWIHDVELWGRKDAVLDLAGKVLRRSAGMTSIIDFDDMLWLPVIHELGFPGVDFLFIDECQDLNPLQHELAERLSGSGRTIVVGDPYQAIYAWRGAATDSIPRLRDRLGAKTLPLTATWRCPRSHVGLARRIVPDFQAAPGAPEGELWEDGLNAIDQAGPGGLVLCRANAPLVSACLRAIAGGRPAMVRGRSIGEGLVSIVQRSRAMAQAATIAEFVRGIDQWRVAQLTVLAEKEGAEAKIEAVIDQADCLEAIARGCASPGEIEGLIGSYFRDSAPADRITFSSVHRAKGSEAREVTYIDIGYSDKRDRERPPQAWEVQQRKNLRYVALTRSLHSLTLACG